MKNGNSSPVRVLVVEDNSDSAEILQTLLQGYEVRVAPGFQAAVSMMKRYVFDAYVLDRYLPDGDGIELCRQIRDFDPNVPIIFLSAAALPDDKRLAAEAGSDVYLTKPTGTATVAVSLANRLRAAKISSLEAHSEELRVVSEELRSIRRDLSSRSKDAKRLRKEALGQLLQTRARLGFIAAGGTRADFERLWPTLAEDLQGRMR